MNCTWSVLNALYMAVKSLITLMTIVPNGKAARFQ